MKIFGNLGDGRVHYIVLEVDDILKARTVYNEIYEASRTAKEAVEEQKSRKVGLHMVSYRCEISPTLVLIGARIFTDALGIFNFVVGSQKPPTEGIEVGKANFDNIDRDKRSEGITLGYFGEAYKEARVRLSEVLGIRELMRGYFLGEWHFRGGYTFI
jgi:hypothetical protein